MPMALGGFSGCGSESGLPFWINSQIAHRAHSECKMADLLKESIQGSLWGDPPGGSPWDLPGGLPLGDPPVGIPRGVPLRDLPGVSPRGITWGGSPGGGFTEVPDRFWFESGPTQGRFWGDSGTIIRRFWADCLSIRVTSSAFLRAAVLFRCIRRYAGFQPLLRRPLISQSCPPDEFPHLV